MQSCSLLLSIILLQYSVNGVLIQRQSPELVDWFTSRSQLGPWSRPAGTETGKLDHLMTTENDIMEPKWKRSLPGNTTPLDRLSISAMETKQGSNKQSKDVELPRQRVVPSPIDKIGISRLPSNRG